MVSELRAAGDLSGLRMSSGLREWIAEFRPDVVYAVLGGNTRLLRLAADVATVCDKPLVPHFLDDWPSTLYTGGELFGLARRRMSADLARVIHASAAGVCVSQPMADEYRARYRLPFVVFGNCVDESAFGERVSTPAALPGGARPAVRLVYVGGLGNGRWRSLVAVAAAMRTAGDGARLVIHTPAADLRAYGGALVALPGVRMGGEIDSAQVPQALADAEILLHVESFDAEHPAVYAPVAVHQDPAVPRLPPGDPRLRAGRAGIDEAHRGGSRGRGGRRRAPGSAGRGGGVAVR